VNPARQSRRLGSDELPKAILFRWSLLPGDADATCILHVLFPLTMNRPPVARICNLLYRRISFGWMLGHSKRCGAFAAWRITNPRYSRLQICATGWHHSPSAGLFRVQRAKFRFGEISPRPSPLGRGRSVLRLVTNRATGFANEPLEKRKASACYSLSPGRGQGEGKQDTQRLIT
jgi:hypothetical protein